VAEHLESGWNENYSTAVQKYLGEVVDPFPKTGRVTGNPSVIPIKEGLTNRELSPTFTDGPSDSNYSGFDAISAKAVIRRLAVSASVR